MRKLVVFYSLEGNTRLAAKTIAEASGADIMELIPLSQPSSEGFSRFLRGGKSAVKKEIPELEPFGVNPDDYELIFLGSPVWAWTFTPAVRAFLEKHDLSGKKVAICMCHERNATGNYHIFSYIDFIGQIEIDTVADITIVADP